MFNRQNRSTGCISGIRKRSNQRYFKLIFKQMSSHGSQSQSFNTFRKKVTSHHIDRKSMGELGHRKNYSIKDNSDVGERFRSKKKISTGDLNQKLRQIEKIRNYQRPRTIKKKRLSNFCQGSQTFKNSEEAFLKSEKISKSTYQCVLGMQAKKKKQKQPFSCGSAGHPNLTNQQIKSLHEERPNEFCNFVTGFQNFSKNQEVQQLTCLTKLKTKIKKSQILNNCFTQLTKGGHTDKLKDSQLGSNFASAVKAMEYIKKNGVLGPKSKMMLQMAMCSV